ncbi:MAG: GerAB/ArcD/ProY family transporter [Clostridiaceae bacterium]|nr:GerAB/ArcD/ProY family transporter [Clostridiaceae bacterium]
MSGKKVQIGRRQFSFLITTMAISTVDIFVPAFIAQEAKNDSWIAAVIAGVAIFPVSFIMLKLYRRYEGLTLIEICRKAAGRFFGTIFGLLYLLYFIVIAFSVSAEMGHVIKIALLNLSTPRLS